MNSSDLGESRFFQNLSMSQTYTVDGRNSSPAEMENLPSFTVGVSKLK